MSPLEPAAWRGLSEHAALQISATVLAYVAASRVSRWAGGHPLLNPTLMTILLIVGALQVTGLPYEAYLRGTTALSFLLGPAIVLLAVPLFRQTPLVLSSRRIILGALAIGLPVGACSAVGIAWLCGGSRALLLSIAPKSVTTGIAIGISERLGGIPALTAVLVIATGIVGAIMGPTVVRVFGAHDERALGLALGIGGHGIATARALQIGEVAGAFAGLGMSLNGVLTAVVLPVVASLL